MLSSMRSNWKLVALPSLMLVVSLAVPAFAADDGPGEAGQLFATTCGWCHSDGGRMAGKGPQLMDSKRDDDFLRNRIKTGKQGAMPAFGGAFSDVQIDGLVKYIRALKPHEG
ncbi:cytochrome c [Bradyrhizobium jicamae]|nr:cytochrome c [Bradyrhizobium jicamae]MBR0753948.1 cytochrome c [Bradyrhizobium jicamae]